MSFGEAAQSNGPSISASNSAMKVPLSSDVSFSFSRHTNRSRPEGNDYKSLNKVTSRVNCSSGAGSELQDPKKIKSRANCCRYMLGLRSKYIEI